MRTIACWWLMASKNEWNNIVISFFIWTASRLEKLLRCWWKYIETQQKFDLSMLNEWRRKITKRKKVLDQVFGKVFFLLLATFSSNIKSCGQQINKQKIDNQTSFYPSSSVNSRDDFPLQFVYSALILNVTSFHKIWKSSVGVWRLLNASVNNLVIQTTWMTTIIRKRRKGVLI